MTIVENIINEICEDKGLDTISFSENGYQDLKLRDDIGFDSFDLAQLTVMIEDEFDIDIFEDGIVSTVREILQKLP